MSLGMTQIAHLLFLLTTIANHNARPALPVQKTMSSQKQSQG